MRYVALLRGINVGGNTMIKMAELKAVFEQLGFENVVSYINSGNLAFDCKKEGEEKLVSKLEKAIEDKFGKSVAVMVREQKDIVQVCAGNPFEGQFESHKEMHVLFLKEPMTDEQKGILRSLTPEKERFVTKGREIYCHLPLGVADSFLGRGQFEKKLKISVTARNWRTVQKLSEL